MKCRENGISRILLTRIPMFKEVVIISFACQHCGWENNEIQSAGRIQDEGIKIQLRIQNKKDISRQLVKTDAATVIIPELGFEIPAKSQQGEVTTIEGLLQRATEGLRQDQPVRKIMDPDVHDKIKVVITELEMCQSGGRLFTLELDDPSGNSFIENICAPKKDPQMTVMSYKRSAEQDILLGLRADDDTGRDQTEVAAGPITQDEVLSFPTNCPECGSPCETRMKLVDIPHFKQVVIMALTCDRCGCKSNEVKSGGGVSEFGQRVTLKMTSKEDLSRDVLKSETAVVLIPELDVEVYCCSMGGKFTTLEGLLHDIKQELKKTAPFSFGDSARKDFVLQMKQFLQKLDKVISGEHLVEVVIDDPAGNSYVQNPYAPDADPHMVLEQYERNYEQNEELGMNDMKTEGYRQGSEND
ncbi:zinc finger protein ZPR1-like [Corticium candelabrum]|uniref:zinc finger protein ZPR1-like n=1 Tax=Corticium candelabrum TaxID=121492 RepID=UPI002E257CF5|nr:zinc finger protein ZPR1-like [Corticium candelabrum]